MELTEEQVHKAGVDPAHSPGLGPQSWCQGTCPGGPGLGGGRGILLTEALLLRLALRAPRLWGH